MKFKATKDADHCVKVKDEFGDVLHVATDDLQKCDYIIFQVNNGKRVIVDDAKALKLAKLIKRTIKARRTA